MADPVHEDYRLFHGDGDIWIAHAGPGCICVSVVPS